VRRPPRLRAMAKETSPTDSSLALHEVLEAEFVTLHGYGQRHLAIPG
jgi:hypothetical protein